MYQSYTTSTDLNMPDDANDEGHSTGWLDIAFDMQR